MIGSTVHIQFKLSVKPSVANTYIFPYRLQILIFVVCSRNICNPLQFLVSSSNAEEGLIIEVCYIHICSVHNWRCPYRLLRSSKCKWMGLTHAGTSPVNRGWLLFVPKMFPQMLGSSSHCCVQALIYSNFGHCEGRNLSCCRYCVHILSEVAGRPLGGCESCLCVAVRIAFSTFTENFPVVDSAYIQWNRNLMSGRVSV
jgi:hypothetical protein